MSKETKSAAIKFEEAFASSLKCRDQIYSSLFLLHDENLKNEFSKDGLNLYQGLSSFELLHQESRADRLTQSTKLILTKVQETWPLIHSHCFVVALKVLRACKEELCIISSDVKGPGTDFIAFAMDYVLVIELVAKIWQNMQKSKSLQVHGMASLDILIEKMEKSLRRINHCFSGLSTEEESHLLELLLLSQVLRLHRTGILSHDTLKNMHAAKSRLQILHKDGTRISDFIRELKKYCAEGRAGEASPAFPSDKLLQLFHLMPMPFCGNYRHIKADLKALHSSSENPLPFVPGLPVGITFRFVLYNVPQGKKVWLRMAVGSSIQYIFIDIANFRDHNEVRNFALTLPFYSTPRAASFVLKACICLELPGEDALRLKAQLGGPRHYSMEISEEVDVYCVGM